MRKIMMQCTVEHLHKLNPKILKELESGEPFQVFGNEEIGFYYSWDEVKDATGYKIYRDDELIQSAPENSYADYKLKFETEFNYSI